EKQIAMLTGSSKFHRHQQTYGSNVLLSGCLVLLVASIVILASTPPVSRDALTHHLAMPKLYLKQGAIYEIPYAKWSYYPMNLDLLYMIPLYFGNDIIPKFIHFAFALLTGGFIFRYLKKRSELPYAILGVVFFLSIPVIVKLSITVYVDLGLIFFSFAALTYLFRWIETDFKLKSLVASAICCGIALGTKYNALICYFLLTLFIVFVYSRLSPSTHANQIKALVYGAVFMLIAATVFSPWAIRNFKWTNNPLYPLYDSWFNPTKTEFHDIIEPRVVHNSNEDSNAGINASNGRWTHFAIRKIIFNEKWWEIALIPIRIFFQGRDGNPKYFDGKLNPLLFFLPFFAFMGMRSNSQQLQIEKKIMLAFAVLFIFLAFLQRDMRIRYIGPAIPPLVVLSILGLQSIIGV
ncbi:MAG: glycosyltransferase family 39 protein, partial [Desulfobacterales bacterium]|nr:glycosyltransferase family 39 protein [Desulfobacterales bacterium]